MDNNKNIPIDQTDKSKERNEGDEGNKNDDAIIESNNICSTPDTNLSKTKINNFIDDVWDLDGKMIDPNLKIDESIVPKGIDGMDVDGFDIINAMYVDTRKKEDDISTKPIVKKVLAVSKPIPIPIPKKQKHKKKLACSLLYENEYDSYYDEYDKYYKW